MASQTPPRLPLWKEIGLSWLSLKRWVRIWLVVLNALFLGAVFWAERPIGRWTLLAWGAAGLCLAPLLVHQRGLTRLLALGHLVPWTPLLVYLLLRLTSSVAGPRIEPAQEPTLFLWTATLTAAVAACLGLDAWDLVRWIRGERFVMGSPDAVRAGASALARHRRGVTARDA